MDEVIGTVSQKFGIPEDASRQVVGHILNFMDNQFGQQSGQSWLARLPGAEALIQQVKDRSEGASAPERPPEPTAAAVEALGLGDPGQDMIGTTSGDTAQQTASAAQALFGKVREAGLDQGETAEIARQVASYVEARTGPEIASKVRAALPLLRGAPE